MKLDPLKGWRPARPSGAERIRAAAVRAANRRPSDPTLRDIVCHAHVYRGRPRPGEAYGWWADCPPMFYYLGLTVSDAVSRIEEGDTWV